MAAMTGILQGLSDALGKHITYMQQEKLRKGDRAFQRVMQEEGFAHAAKQGAETRTFTQLSRVCLAENIQLNRVCLAELARSRTGFAWQGTRINGGC